MTSKIQGTTGAIVRNAHTSEEFQKLDPRVTLPRGLQFPLAW